MITTAAIADALQGQGGFFASVGGGPVSCEIGLAVLDVIEEERLQDNALRVGGALRARTRASSSRATRSPAPCTAWASTSVWTSCATATTREPAREEAYAICERMRERGAIVQPTGDGENVLKLKPPLVIEARDADWLVETLDGVLSRGW